MRVAVVSAGQYKKDNKFGRTFCGKVFSDLCDATEMEVPGLGSGRDKVGYEQREVADHAEILDRVRDGYGGVVKLKMKRRQELRVSGKCLLSWLKFCHRCV